MTKEKSVPMTLDGVLIACEHIGSSLNKEGATMPLRQKIAEIHTAALKASRTDAATIADLEKKLAELGDVPDEAKRPEYVKRK